MKRSGLISEYYEKGLEEFPEMLDSLETHIDQAMLLNPLTGIEKHICLLLLTGNTAKEIASLRSCSYRTVERHVANIKIKIGGVKLSPAALLVIHSLDQEE
jgi:DNA-binding CsgD family transcriptional regulator|tara:strand:+ start:126 stop:428 length:303 start_codon:yes stop_codon:yes gene_type:complete